VNKIGVAEQKITREKKDSIPGGLPSDGWSKGDTVAKARLHSVRIGKGAPELGESPRLPSGDLGAWTFTARDKPARILQVQRITRKPQAAMAGIISTASRTQSEDR